jgi:hypothetical protein
MIKQRGSIRFHSIIFIGSFLFAACGPSAQKDKAAAEIDTTAAAGGTAKDSDKDMGGKAVIVYAHGFSIDYFDHYKLVRVFNHLTARTDTLTYLLVQRGYPAPAGYPGAEVINIPVQTMIGMSSMHIALADFVGVTDRIVGSICHVPFCQAANQIR